MQAEVLTSREELVDGRRRRRYEATVMALTRAGRALRELADLVLE